jgi:hypothetical protein
MSTLLVQYEGVLQTDRDQPILDGFLLVQSLALGMRLVIATSATEARVAHQLRTEKLTDKIAEVIDRSVDLRPLPLWQRQIEVARTRYPVTMVLTARPEVAEWVVGHGITSLFFAHPGFSRPALRPDIGNRKWSSLVTEMEGRIK